MPCFDPRLDDDLRERIQGLVRGERPPWAGGGEQLTSALDAFHLRVRLASGEVAPPRPWVVDWAKWAKSAILAHWASRKA